MAEQEHINVWLRLRGARKYIAEMKLAQVAGRRFSGGMALMGHHIGTTSKKANAFRQSATIMRKSIVGLAGASLAFGSIALFASVLDFEEAMARTKATLKGTEGFTDKMFVDLQDKAMEMGAASRFSSTEVAQGTFELASAGLKAQEVLEALKGTTHLAGAAGIDMAEAAKIQAITLNQFGLEASEAGRVADILTKSVNEGSAQLPALANSLSYVGPVASKFGTNIEDVITALTLLGNKGIESSKAGTSLRQLFIRLTRPTKMVKMAFKDLNMSADDLVDPKTGNLYALPVLLGKLQKGLNKVDPTTARRALSQITGAEGITAVLTLLDQLGPEWDVMSESIRNSEGAAEEFSEIMMDTVKGNLDEVINTMQNWAIMLLRAWSPAIKSGLTQAKDLMLSLQDGSSTARKHLDPFFKTFVSFLGIVATLFRAAWPAVVVGIAMFLAAFRFIAPLMEGANKLFKIMQPVLEAFLVAFVAFIVPTFMVAKGIMLVKWAWMLLNKAFALTPLGRIIVGSIMIVYLLRMLYQRSDRFKGIVDATWKVLKMVAAWILDKFVWAIKHGLLGPIPLIIARWGEVKDNFWSVINGIKGAWDGAIGFFKKLPGRVGGALKGLWDSIPEMFKAALNAVIGWWNDFEVKIDVPDFLPGIPDEIVFSTPNIPTLGRGGDITRAGAYIVGDRGPEMVSLSEGSRVVPLRAPVADPGGNLPRDAGGPELVVLRVDLDGRTVAEAEHRYKQSRKARK